MTDKIKITKKQSERKGITIWYSTKKCPQCKAHNITTDGTLEWCLCGWKNYEVIDE
jgi:molybdenum cofactor biosynthesis enzyme MoaA